MIPTLWLEPHISARDEIVAFAAAIEGFPVVVDLTANPALIGGALSGKDVQVAVRIGAHLRASSDSQAATHALQSEIISALCASTRPKLDFLLVRHRMSLSIPLLLGIRTALQFAKGEDLVGPTGMSVEAAPEDALRAYREVGQFSFVRCEDSPECAEIRAEARQILNLGGEAWPRSIVVSSAEEAAKVFRESGLFPTPASDHSRS